MAVNLDGLHPTLMRPRVEALLADPEAEDLGIYVVSAFRSVARQTALFAAAVVKYGSVAAARKWVAPPGRSNHGPRVDGYGTAVDLGLPGVKAVSGQWPDRKKNAVDAIARRHGLFSPMQWEDWHFEPIPGWRPPAAAPPEEDLMRTPVSVHVAPKERGKWQQAVLPQFSFDKVSHVQVCANDDGGPIRAHVEPFAGFGGILAVTLVSLDFEIRDGKIGRLGVPEGEIKLLVEHR